VRRFIDRLFPVETMAKSDSFFIRAKVSDLTPSVFQEAEIDLGSFVNLGVSKSTLLRVHNVAIQYADSGTVETPIYSIVAGGAKFAWQLTTQSQTLLVNADDKSLVASGSMQTFGDPTSTAHGVSMSEHGDVNPQMWRNGYLIAVDSIFFGCDSAGTVASGTIDMAIVIECTLENATQASSTALALSQQ
jgi:hypothetical protein